VRTGPIEAIPLDFLLEDYGSIILLRPVTASAREWVGDNIGQDNGYQGLWPTVTLEGRYLAPILEGISQAGLIRHQPSWFDVAVPVKNRALMKKIKPSDLRRQAERMLREGSMPSLDTVLQAVADAREEYSAEIKGSRNRRGKQRRPHRVADVSGWAGSALYCEPRRVGRD
jgi:hypothetical protein